MGLGSPESWQLYIHSICVSHCAPKGHFGGRVTTEVTSLQGNEQHEPLKLMVN